MHRGAPPDASKFFYCPPLDVAAQNIAHAESTFIDFVSHLYLPKSPPHIAFLASTMVSTRKIVTPSSQTEARNLRAQLFPSKTPENASPLPHVVAVTTSESKDRQQQYISADAVMSGGDLQPKIHDCTVYVKHGSRESNFRVFYKRHKYLPFNGTARDVNGDIAIMRVSSSNPTHLVNLRSCDKSLVRFVLKRVSPHLKTHQRYRWVLPRNLEFARARR
ncbi:hypothetical protein R3P38DRAFT_3219029 [Favolaschia claudopus]|uniref:Uncharacterized protein n=1 Tax=Favolaschia claudopus TaxID=2862362 RepID=A0AAW0A216_9AGAR